MAIARETVLTNIKPLEGATIRRYTYGGTVVAGNLLSLNGSGQAVKANTASITLATVLGVALQGGGSGDRGDVVISGPVRRARRNRRHEGEHCRHQRERYGAPRAAIPNRI